MSIARHHAEWLSLLEISGPFLSMPVLLDAFPQGLDALDTDHARELRAAYEEWADNQQGLQPEPAIHTAWIRYVLANTLELPDKVIAGGQTIPAGLKATVPEHGVTLRPDLVILDPNRSRQDAEESSRQDAKNAKKDKNKENLAASAPLREDTLSSGIRLLIQVYPAAQDLEKTVTGDPWQATPGTRMMTLLHATGVRLGLVTNGEQWLLVNAPAGETTGFISWYASLWLEEKLTLRAFHTLLGVERFFNVPETQTLEALLAASAKDQQEVTDQLGYQVRRAVEILIQAIDRADQDRGRSLLAGLDESVLYEAALTVMMRLVFLLTAEERKLLPLDDPFYSENYAVATLRAQQSELADKYGEELLEYRYDAWSRLLATWRVVHGGLYHDRLTLPAYGGSLFDPDRFPFLEGRSSKFKVPSSKFRVQSSEFKVQSLESNREPETMNHEPRTMNSDPATPLPINNRTVLHLLNALQLLQVKVPGGGPAEARRLSFRALDIEQIGHVYEGLLDHTAVRADEPVLGLTGTRDKEPEIPLSKLEAFVSSEFNVQSSELGADFDAVNPKLLDFLKEETGRSESALRKALSPPFAVPNSQIQTKNHEQRTLNSKLRAACGNDETLFQRVLPWAGLIRADDFDHPIVIPAGSVYVTAGTERRATGTHYTPKALTEPIVQHTLEPLIYDGPAEGKPREAWRLHPAATLLDLKICDMAMGSGAFLVQTCRYLSERLVEAWDQVQSSKFRVQSSKQKTKNSEPGTKNSEPGTKNFELITPEGKPTTNPDEAIPPDPTDRLILARRLVADRCLYGVDKNPLAVEMAKLSLWLATMAKDRPFTFLDHALKCGDSLVGVSLEQLLHWNLDTSGTPALFADTIRTDLDKMITLRRRITVLPVNTAGDQTEKAHLLAKAEAIAHDLKQGGDMLVGSYFNDLSKDEQAYLREALLLAFRNGKDVPPERAAQADLGDLRPFHWQLEFPEVFLAKGRGGFDAFVGNPPFMGTKYIRPKLGRGYFPYLATMVDITPGRADLCAFFLRRIDELLNVSGCSGIIATNTISQGDTQVLALKNLSFRKRIYRAKVDVAWPGVANVRVTLVFWTKYDGHKHQFYLNDKEVKLISEYLTETDISEPHTLSLNSKICFQGSIPNASGLLLSPKEAQELIVSSPNEHEVIKPFFGNNLNSSPYSEIADRWCIFFGDMTESQASYYPLAFERCTKLVKPVKLKKGGSSAKYWWRFYRYSPELYENASKSDKVLVSTIVTKYLSFSLVLANQIFTNKLCVIVLPSWSKFGVLQSTVHEFWARQFSTTLRVDLTYTPTKCFETFPFPHPNPATSIPTLDTIGETYHEYRRQLMLDREEGLTATYNRFHDPEETAADIVRLRALHVEMDNAVAAAYGWDDLDLGHDFHETAQGLRYTISEAARREVLGRLLELNHARYEEEVLAGLHEKGGKKGSRQGAKAPSRQGNQKSGSRGAGEQGGKGTAGPVSGKQASLPGMEDDRPKQLGLFGEEQ